MASVTDEQLITIARSTLNPQRVGTAHLADVGCALLSSTGEVYTGASIGTHLGICAEQGTASALVSRERAVVDTIVAVWEDEVGEPHALPPCGRCRELLHRLSPENLATRVILGRGHVVALRDLLPFPGWHAEPV